MFILRGRQDKNSPTNKKGESNEVFPRQVIATRKKTNEFLPLKDLKKSNEHKIEVV